MKNNFTQDFEKWLKEKSNPIHGSTVGLYNVVFDPYKLSVFEKLPIQMQFGVYQEFFAEKGILIQIEKTLNDLKEWLWTYYLDREHSNFGHSKSQSEAMTSCIEKGKEIYNSLEQ